jgi:uncharacterized membrane protein
VESPSKLFAAVLGLTAFAVSIVTGLAAGADASATLRRAIVSMVVCYGVGAVLGVVAGHAIREYLAGYRAQHVPPSMDEAVAMYAIEVEPEE